MVRCCTMAVTPAVRAVSAGGMVSTLGTVALCAGMFIGCITPGSQTPGTGLLDVCQAFIEDCSLSPGVWCHIRVTLHGSAWSLPLERHYGT